MKKVGSVLLLILFAVPLPIALGAVGMVTVALPIVTEQFRDTGTAGVVLILVLFLLVAAYLITYGFACLKTYDKKRMSFYTLAPGLHILVVILYAALMNPMADLLGVSVSYFGLRVKDYTVVESLDTHGGFHGDGSYYCILDCSQNRENALEVVKEWNELPLPRNLEALMYGGVYNGCHYWGLWEEEGKIPKVERGYYVFYDRHSESEDPSDPSGLQNRSSYNFTIAIYDCDTDRAYYFEEDT